MRYIRGWIGLGIFFVSIVLWCFESTRTIALYAGGFSMGMMSSGFQ